MTCQSYTHRASYTYIVSLFLFFVSKVPTLGNSHSNVFLLFFSFIKYLLNQWHRFYLEKKMLEVERNEKRGENKLKKIRNCKEKIQDHENIVNMSLILEAGIESAFQFYLQSLYSMPSTLNQSGTLSDMFNLTNFSIAASFVSYANTCVTIRWQSCNSGSLSIMSFLALSSALICL